MKTYTLKSTVKKLALSLMVMFTMILTPLVPTYVSAATGGIGYTIQETFPDSNMAQSVADQIVSGDVSHVLTQADIDNTLSLSFPGSYPITDITGISVFENLEYLEIYQNFNLTTIPDEILSLTNLTHLNLRYNGIQTLPDRLGELTNLTYLNVSSNSLTTLPSSIWALNQLRYLDISYIGEAGLTSLPDVFDSLPNLTYFGAAGHKLTALPSSLWNLSNLTTLYLNDNLLPTLPTEIGQLTALQRLFVGGNQLTALPESLWNLTNLVDLDISGNQLTSLSSNIGNLVNLQQLRAQVNQLTALPVEFGNLINLWWLDLGTNQISSLPDSFGDLVALRYLYVHSNELTTFPNTIGNLVNLQFFYAWSNNISYIPDTMGEMLSLIELDLNSNELSAIPSTLSNLVNLQRLSLSSNYLSSLPDSVWSLSQLRYLGIGDNLFTLLPSNINQLVRLEVLFAGGNQLIVLPDELGDLANLVELSVPRNQLVALPEIDYSRLKSLDVSFNQLTNLPNSFITFDKNNLWNFFTFENLLPSDYANSLNTLFNTTEFWQQQQKQLILNQEPSFDIKTQADFDAINPEDYVAIAGDDTLSNTHKYAYGTFTNQSGNPVALEDYLLDGEVIQSGTIYANVRLQGVDGLLEPTSDFPSTLERIQFNFIFQAKTYDLTFDLNGGEGIPPLVQTLEEGVLVAEPTIPIRTGYTFLGWNTSIDGSGTNWNFDTMTMPANDMMLFAQWEVVPTLTYALTFDLNGGEGVPPAVQILEEGMQVLKPMLPVRDGYVFLRWNTSIDGSGTNWDFDTMTMPANDMTLFAQWEADPVYMLSFDLNGGQGIKFNPQLLLVGSLAKNPGTPSRAGFTFVGWNTSQDGSGLVWDFTISTMPSQDVMLYAQWSQQELPETGESSNVIGFSGLVLLVTSGTLLFLNKRRKENNN